MQVADRWYRDPKYSHGYLVPLFAAWLLWSRWRKASQSGQELWIGTVWGLVVLAAGVALHLAGAYVYLDVLCDGSLLVCLVGLSLCLGGLRLLRVAGPSIAFLVFMLPLPHSVEVALAQPLQKVATTASTYLLQMMGFYAYAEGNIINLNNTKLGVVEACSGLGMLVTFFALTVAVAIVMKRPMLDRVIIVVSAVPVAVIANVLRIAVTGTLGELVGPHVAYFVYHYGAGLFMVPFGLALLWVELKLLSRLLVEVPVADERDIARTLAPDAKAPARRKRGKARVDSFAPRRSR
jgi:exosortase